MIFCLPTQLRENRAVGSEGSRRCAFPANSQASCEPVSASRMSSNEMKAGEDMLISPKVLPANADWPHEPSQDEWWQESVVMTWADPSAEMGGIIRLGHQPNRGFAKCCFGIVSQNGPGYTRSAQDLPIGPKDRAKDTFSVDEFCSATIDGQRSRWFADDAQCMLDIEVVDVHETYDFFSLIPRNEVTKTIIPNHIQGAGSFNGRVRLGQMERNISGFTYRDHSWGTRLLHNPKADFYSAWWLGGALGPDFAFGFGDGRSQSGHSMPFGYIVKNGEAHTVVVDDAWVGVSFGDAMSNRCARVTVSSEELGKMTFEARGYGNIVLEMEKKHFELSMPCTISCNGRTGGGSVETIFNPRNGTDRPFWLEGASLRNGLCAFRDGKLVQSGFARTEGL